MSTDPRNLLNASLVPEAKMNRHDRRAKKVLDRDPHKALRRAGYEGTAALTAEAYRRVVNLMLAQAGDDTEGEPVLSPAHSEALFHLLGCMATLATQRKPGRYAFDLSTGGGKSTSIVAFVSALAAMGLPHTVAVASEKVEGLCSLYRDLKAQGVPEESIGLWHSYEHDPRQAERIRNGAQPRDGYASEPCTKGDLTTKRYLLVTHQRVRSGLDVKLLSTYRDDAGPRPRSIVIWDEAMLSSTHTSIRFPRFQGQLGGLQTIIKTWPSPEEGVQRIVDYLDTCSKLLLSEWERQKRDIKSVGNTEPKALKMPEEGLPSADDIKVFRKAFRQDSQVGELLAFLTESARRPVRIVYSAQGLISFDMAVPPDLDRIAILDASAPIRLLMQMDPSIKTWAGFNGRVVDYERVKVHTLKHGAGRSTLEDKWFDTFGTTGRGLLDDVASVVKDQIPEDEAVLIFTFKTTDTRRDMQAVIAQHLTNAGVDVMATVDFRGQKRPRIAFLTWGLETSLSHYQYCRHVILCGVLERSNWDIAGAISGAKRDLKAELLPSLINTVKLSESCNITYQAMSRGSCRRIRNGKASAMDVWLFHNDPDALREWLTDNEETAVMPGAQWLQWDAENTSPDPEKVADAAKVIRAFLDTLSPNVTRISLRSVIKLSEVKGSPKTLQRARDEAIAGSGWHIEGQSLVRYFLPTEGEV